MKFVYMIVWQLNYVNKLFLLVREVIGFTRIKFMVDLGIH
jgi:hypothetical protein